MSNARKISIRLFVFVCSFSLQAQNQPQTPRLETLAAFVDSVAQSTMARYSIPGLAVGIVQQDSVLYTKGYGVRELGEGTPVTPQSVFHTASISKLFTAMAILQLAETEALSLEDLLVEVIPEMQYADDRVEAITIRHLLNHTSGLPDTGSYGWNKQAEHEAALAEYIEGLTLRLRSDPGEEYHYSNIGYDILGRVVEKRSGTSFESYVEQRILYPAGMSVSDFRYFKIPDSLRAAPHSKRRLSGKVYARKVYPYTREHSPSSTLQASVEDLSQWMVYFLKNYRAGNSGSLWKKMLEPSTAASPGIGLGFQLYDFDSFKGVGHFGGDRGFRSFLLMLPEEGIGLVILGNADFDEDYRQEILLPVADVLLLGKRGNSDG